MYQNIKKLNKIDLINYLNLCYIYTIMDTSNLISIQKDQDDIKDTILKNTIKMITSRKLLKKSKLEQNIKNILSYKPDDYIYKIKTDNGEIIVKLMLQNITTVNKTTSVYEFLNSYKNKKNILVIKSITKTPFNIITGRYINTELFFEKDLMIDKTECNLVPKFEILTEDEKKDYYEKYNVTKVGCLKISNVDPMVRYYGAKPGDVLRITRPSETSGFSIAYRLVVKKDM